ncbi:MAG: hypothetical protein AABY54_07945, partial [Deltaproteobacteria bacterium]
VHPFYSPKNSHNAVYSIAKHLGRDQATISIAVTKLRERLGKDAHLAGQVLSIMETLRTGRNIKYQINNV